MMFAIEKKSVLSVASIATVPINALERQESQLFSSGQSSSSTFSTNLKHLLFIESALDLSYHVVTHSRCLPCWERYICCHSSVWVQCAVDAQQEEDGE